MQVRGDRVRDRPGSHHIHGNAVGEAVTLVTPGFVECQALEERLARLRDHFDGRVSEDIANESSGFGSGLRPCCGAGARNSTSTSSVVICLAEPMRRLACRAERRQESLLLKTAIQ